MMLSGLSDEELLRVAVPTTDLERLLIERLTESADEVGYMEIEAQEMRIMMAAQTCDQCRAKSKEIIGYMDKIAVLEKRLKFKRVK